ncbi:DUF1992 domain-containing protein [Actinobacteria bacterium YIM 96077]|uniref:DUF1992 domain-containing protein n=2 Tax=Phytoactinopolyspora halophila TaxID=1981511 RepID=A0A329QAX4_9ACTN|nr:DUF1992 domain-containing protein [Actinobacteria bacterium YIM 96077]RAW09483.1 DUF1992 domain-containing protein [Phytoactinopolyspora halophila]
MSFESWIERQIREAQERGEFDNLPGAGKPLPEFGKAHDEMWWVKQKLEREGLPTDAVLPTPLKLRKEIDRLPETVRDLPSEDAVRDVVRNLNEQIVEYMRAPSGPQIPISLVDVERIVEQWRDGHEDRSARPGEPARPGQPADPPVAAERSGRHRPWWRRLVRRGGDD